MTNNAQKNLAQLAEENEALRKEVNTLRGETNALRIERDGLRTRVANNNALSIDTLTLMAEDAFNARNWAAIKQRDGMGDVFDTGQEVTEFKAHWHYARPIESVLDGLHKALYGSEWNGRKKKGAVDYRTDLVLALERKMPQTEAIKAVGGNVLAAVRQDGEATAILEAIANQENVIEKLKEITEVVTTALAISSNGGEYSTPAERAAQYAERDAKSAEAEGRINALLAALSTERAAEKAQG